MIFELSRAASALESIQGHIKRQDWAEVMQGYAEARLALVRMSQFPSGLSEGAKEQIGIIADQIEKSSKRAGVNMIKGSDQAEIVRILQSNSDYQIAVTRIHAGIDRITTDG